MAKQKKEKEPKLRRAILIDPKYHTVEEVQYASASFNTQKYGVYALLGVDIVKDAHPYKMGWLGRAIAWVDEEGLLKKERYSVSLRNGMPPVVGKVLLCYQGKDFTMTPEEVRQHIAFLSYKEEKPEKIGK
jgi:hypothetical protein